MFIIILMTDYLHSNNEALQSSGPFRAHLQSCYIKRKKNKKKQKKRLLNPAAVGATADV